MNKLEPQFKKRSIRERIRCTLSAIFNYRQNSDSEWQEFELWAWQRLWSYPHLSPEQRQRQYKIACKVHEERVKKLNELITERDRVTAEMEGRGATREEIEAYWDSVYPEIHMYLTASRSLY